MVLQFILDFSLGFRSFFQKFGESLLCSVPIIVNNFIGSLLEELDSGESLDLDLLKLVGSAVHLGNDYGLVVLVFLSKFIPDGCKLLAVAAPWSIELN